MIDEAEADWVAPTTVILTWHKLILVDSCRVRHVKFRRECLPPDSAMA